MITDENGVSDMIAAMENPPATRTLIAMTSEAS
jgi:hypothetical protein